MTPCGDDPQATLLVTDANGLFGLAVDTVRMMQLAGIVPSLLVVGVGYPPHEIWPDHQATRTTSDGPVDPDRGLSSSDSRSEARRTTPVDPVLVDTVQIRARDFTPTRTGVFEQGGGASNFAEFLDGDLRSHIAGRFPKAAGDLTFFGHSLGGLFGCYVMLTNHQVFDRYIISSPSLWWDERLVFQLERERASRSNDLSTTAFFGIGGLETDDGRRQESRNLAQGHPAKAADTYLDMVADMRLFVESLRGRNYPGLDLETAVIADEFHTTVAGVILSRGLRHTWMYRDS